MSGSQLMQPSRCWGWPFLVEAESNALRLREGLGFCDYQIGHASGVVPHGRAEDASMPKR